MIVALVVVRGPRRLRRPPSLAHSASPTPGTLGHRSPGSPAAAVSPTSIRQGWAACRCTSRHMGSGCTRAPISRRTRPISQSIGPLPRGFCYQENSASGIPGTNPGDTISDYSRIGATFMMGICQVENGALRNSGIPPADRRECWQHLAFSALTARDKGPDTPRDELLYRWFALQPVA